MLLCKMSWRRLEDLDSMSLDEMADCQKWMQKVTRFFIPIQPLIYIKLENDHNKI